jgi:hypothetical protein
MIITTVRVAPGYYKGSPLEKQGSPLPLLQLMLQGRPLDAPKTLGGFFLPANEYLDVACKKDEKSVIRLKTEIRLIV